MIAEGGRTTVRIEFLAVLDGAHLERHDLTDIPPFSLAIIIATNSAQASKSSETSLLVPEAGLHRDGEQARLVNLVRRRQLEQCRHDYEAMSTIQWINDSLWKFWTSVIVTDKVDEKIQFDRHEHYADIVNPYRDKERQQARRSGVDRGVKKNVVNSDEQKPTSDESMTAAIGRCRKYPFFDVMMHICQPILNALRYIVHFALGRLLTNRSQSRNSSSTRSYILDFTADDVIQCFIIMWIGLKMAFWLQHDAVSVLVLMFALAGAFRHKIVCCIESANEVTTVHQQHQHQTLHQRKEHIKREMRNNVPPKATAKNIQPQSTINSKKIQQQVIHRLKAQFPNATHAECKRFYVCTKHQEEEAAQRIESWLQWRADCGLKLTADIVHFTKTSDNREYNSEFIRYDSEIWNEAAKLAIELESKGEIVDNLIKLPQILCSYEPEIHTNSTTDLCSKNSKSPPRTRDSSRILHILPARIDIALAPAPTYSLACALYLDRCLCRSTQEKITLLCDVRGGRGWANPTPWSMLPFIQCTSSLLGKHYPERLQKFILFPMPSAAAWIWSAAQKCLDPNTASKVVVIGEEKGKKGLPVKMDEFFDQESLELVEERRRSFMTPSIERNVSEECVRAMLSC